MEGANRDCATKNSKPTHLIKLNAKKHRRSIKTTEKAKVVANALKICCPPNSNDDLGLLFCLYPSSMAKRFIIF